MPVEPVAVECFQSRSTAIGPLKPRRFATARMCRSLTACGGLGWNTPTTTRPSAACWRRNASSSGSVLAQKWQPSVHQRTSTTLPRSCASESGGPIQRVKVQSGAGVSSSSTPESGSSAGEGCACAAAGGPSLACARFAAASAGATDAASMNAAPRAVRSIRMVRGDYRKCGPLPIPV